MPIDWTTATERHLLNLIRNGDTETHYLDFKRPDTLIAQTAGEKKKRLEDVSVQVSSFAHADGGAIIYGMEESGNPPVATRLRGFRANEMQLIQTVPQPGVSGVYVNSVRLRSQNAASDPGTSAFVVVVPQSNTIHEARDENFHRRDNTATRPMHRDDIIDVLGRARGPKLTLEVSLEQGRSEIEINWATITEFSQLLTFDLACRNDAKIARDALFRLFVETIPDFEIGPMIGSGFPYARSSNPPGLDDPVRRFRALQYRLMSPPNLPIFPGEVVGLGSLSVKVAQSARHSGGRVYLYWQCVAPDMADSHGGAMLFKDGDRLLAQEAPASDTARFFGL
jgi:hypothetical protein